jgi:potassium channel subfamily K
VTSFAVQTITNVVSSVTQARFDKQREKLGLDNRMPPDAEAEPRSADPANPIFVAHAEWVERQHELFDDRVAPGKALEDLTESEARAADAALLDELLSAALRLEAQARAIMVGQLPVAGRASLLLKADRNVQQRDLAALERAGVRAGGEEEGAQAGLPGRVDDSFEELEVLQQVHLYRKTFAAILAAGSKLKRLQGQTSCGRRESVLTYSS